MADYEALRGAHKVYEAAPQTTYDRVGAPVGAAQPAPAAHYYEIPELKSRQARVKGLEDTVDRTLSRGGSESILEQGGMKDGQYTIRCSASHPGSFVLVVAFAGSFKHYPIEACAAPYEGLFSVLCPGTRRRFNSLLDVISHYERQQEGIACRLTQRLK